MLLFFFGRRGNFTSSKSTERNAAPLKRGWTFWPCLQYFFSASPCIEYTVILQKVQYVYCTFWRHVPVDQMLDGDDQAVNLYETAVKRTMLRILCSRFQRAVEKIAILFSEIPPSYLGSSHYPGDWTTASEQLRLLNHNFSNHGFHRPAISPRHEKCTNIFLISNGVGRQTLL